MKEKDHDAEFMEASLIGGRSLANRQKQRVAIVENTFKHALQPYFITMANNKTIREVPHLRPVLYIKPDVCPVVKARRDAQDKKHVADKRRRPAWR